MNTQALVKVNKISTLRLCSQRLSQNPEVQDLKFTRASFTEELLKDSMIKRRFLDSLVGYNMKKEMSQVNITSSAIEKINIFERLFRRDSDDSDDMELKEDGMDSEDPDDDPFDDSDDDQGFRGWFSDSSSDEDGGQEDCMPCF